ncbi:MAG: nitroreductase [Pseudomonadota bacterium]
MEIDRIIKKRISTRAFSDREVSQELIHELLDVARWSPSGSNMQPWRVTVLAGDPLKVVCDLAQKTLMENPRGEQGRFPVYPPGLKDPYRALRTETGELMYEKLGIDRNDKRGRLSWLANNFRFFGAPVGMFVSIDRELLRPQWAHLGMFMQTFALLAESRGLGTCMQEAWGSVRETVHTHLGLPERNIIYSGIAVGYPNLDASVNTLRTPRLDIDQFATFVGF